MLNLEINLTKYKINNIIATILQICSINGIEIPKFCYFETLSIAGNCRMCLVELNKNLKPIASCAMSIINNIKIYTKSILIKKTRENIIELLLIQHPLDCPICCQGGECDLQDQVFIYGGDRGRFFELKRAVENKNCGSIIKTIMTRCIHCTRCIRFFNEIIGYPYFGTFGRGSLMEIGNYLTITQTSEFSGNVIDLCPVGALTAKPYSFMARVWELKSINSIDIFDSLNSNIKIDIRGFQIMRILPLLNLKINNELITDKIRFIFDGLKIQRILSPFLKKKKFFFKVSWLKILMFLKKFINWQKITIISGLSIEIELLIIIKSFINNLGINSTLFLSKNYLTDFDFRFLYLIKYNINFFENCDFCILINSNLRLDLPFLNLKFRKNFLKKNSLIFIINSVLHLNYFSKQLGNNTKIFLNFLEGNHWICKLFLISIIPVILVGINFLLKYNSIIYKYILIFLKNLFIRFNKNINGINLISNYASQINLFESNLLSNNNNYNFIFSNFYYSFQSDNEEIIYKNIDIFQGHHNDMSATYSKIILPGYTFFEKYSSYLNLNSIFQSTNFILKAKGQCRNDWKILFAIYIYNSFLMYKNFNVLSLYLLKNLKKKLKKYSWYFYNYNFNKIIYYFIINFNKYFIKVKYFNTLFFNINRNYFIDQPINKASLLMMGMQINIKKNFLNFF